VHEQTEPLDPVVVDGSTVHNACPPPSAAPPVSADLAAADALLTRLGHLETPI
jgi:hypothetical protein